MLESGEKAEILLKILKQKYDDKITQPTEILLPKLLSLAQSYAEWIVPGKALPVIVRANTSIPNKPQLLKLLLKHQLLYSQIPEAEETL